ncbi:HWE histidine kinase domain-containing protein [Mesorhizobium sp. KR2-14]|uniref:sensor histidine kinase n=1 Tax=Mesorhizobium sp. KR2-14 TaxID=3156610 RepID=UPI0032B42C68
MLSAGEVGAKATSLFTSNRAWVAYLMFGGAYAALFAFGAYTADNSVLALAWPANAFMLGMLIRFPLLARPPGWMACLVGIGIVAATLGYGLTGAARLAAYNFGIVGIGYIPLSRFSRAEQRLERPMSVLCVLAAVIPASLYAGIAGAVLTGFFDSAEGVDPFRYWFSVELLNQLAILPMILSFPEERHWPRQPPLALRDHAPIIVLMLSGIVGLMFGGMAALAFPVPALLLCAISYRVFVTAVLTFAFCVYTIAAMVFGYVEVSNFSHSQVLSIAIGRALITLGPLIISTTTAIRNEVVEQIKHLAAEREIVSNELEHRIKNLFALVNGLVSLCVREDPDLRPLADKLRNRLVALHLAHGLIRTGNAPSDAADRPASLQELIGVLLSPYEDDANKRCLIDGDDALIEPGIVSSLALVFHELATNSAKYGALSDHEGVLEVHISHRNDQLYINWMEKAAGLTGQDDASHDGFGTKLLDLTIKSQLRGSYTRTWTEGRMAVAIILPWQIPSQPKSAASLDQRM